MRPSFSGLTKDRPGAWPSRSLAAEPSRELGQAARSSRSSTRARATIVSRSPKSRRARTARFSSQSTVELRVDRVDLGPHLRVVLVGEPVPELGALFAQDLDLVMDLFEASHDRFNGRHARGIPCESSALAEENSGRGESLADAVGDGGELERLARHLAEQLVGRRLLALPPTARAGASRPRGARTRRCRIFSRRYARSCASKAQARRYSRGVEALVDVAEVVGGGRLDLRRVGEQLDVARPQRAPDPRRRGTRARRGASRSSAGRARAAVRLPPRRTRTGAGKSSRRSSQTGSVVRYSNTIAQPSVTELSPSRRSSGDSDGVGVGEVLGVAGLVEEGPPVVRPALRLHHEDDAAGHLDRRAERARILVRALLEVELDVRLRVEVDA